MKQERGPWMLNIASVSLTFVILFSWSLSCTGGAPNVRVGTNQMVNRPINEVIEQQSKALMSIPGVVGAGQGLCEGKPCIKVFVVEKTGALDRQIPSFLEGYPVVIEEIGEVKARPGE